MKLKKFDLDHKPRDWWIRSISSDYNSYVGLVYYLGYVNSNYVYSRLVALQICIII